ncbi:MAG: hypothetical protein M3063_16620 [Actinomycetota bacterium]|nr:hypothetical protein [Actinomycetota bacterium]
MAPSRNSFGARGSLDAGGRTYEIFRLAALADRFDVALEYRRNTERYEFLRWGQGAFDNFSVVPPKHRGDLPARGPEVNRSVSSPGM